MKERDVRLVLRSVVQRRMHDEPVEVFARVKLPGDAVGTEEELYEAMGQRLRGASPAVAVAGIRMKLRGLVGASTVRPLRAFDRHETARIVGLLNGWEWRPGSKLRAHEVLEGRYEVPEGLGGAVGVMLDADADLDVRVNRMAASKANKRRWAALQDGGVMSEVLVRFPDDGRVLEQHQRVVDMLLVRPLSTPGGGSLSSGGEEAVVMLREGRKKLAEALHEHNGTAIVDFRTGRVRLVADVTVVERVRKDMADWLRSAAVDETVRVNRKGLPRGCVDALLRDRAAALVGAVQLAWPTLVATEGDMGRVRGSMGGHDVDLHLDRANLELRGYCTADEWEDMMARVGEAIQRQQPGGGGAGPERTCPVCLSAAGDTAWKLMDDKTYMHPECMADEARHTARDKPVRLGGGGPTSMLDLQHVMSPQWLAQRLQHQRAAVQPVEPELKRRLRAWGEPRERGEHAVLECASTGCAGLLLPHLVNRGRAPLAQDRWHVGCAACTAEQCLRCHIVFDDEEGGGGGGGGGGGAADADRLWRMSAAGVFKLCPRCKTGVEHARACMHMTCTCGCHFCYVCGMVFEGGRSPYPHVFQCNNRRVWWTRDDLPVTGKCLCAR